MADPLCQWLDMELAQSPHENVVDHTAIQNSTSAYLLMPKEVQSWLYMESSAHYGQYSFMQACPLRAICSVDAVRLMGHIEPCWVPNRFLIN